MISIFLDTNVLVYGHDRSRPQKRARSREVLRKLDGLQFKGIISTQVLQEFYNTLIGKLRYSKADARIELEQMMDLPTVLMTPPVILAATDLHAHASLSFWDAMIIAAAQSADCDEIWTEDLQDGQRFGKLKVVNPFADITGE